MVTRKDSKEEKQYVIKTIRLPIFLKQWIIDKGMTYSDAIRTAIDMDIDFSHITQEDEKIGKMNYYG